jgi:hypothetical protein
MMKKQHRHLIDIFESQGNMTLQLISQQINRLEKANKALNKISHPLLNECSIANINDNLIILHTNKPHILNEVKLTSSKIINELRSYSSFSNITIVRVKLKYKGQQTIQKKIIQDPKQLPDRSAKDLVELEKNCNCRALQTSIKRLITKHSK